jgi:hypothetical protein
MAPFREGTEVPTDRKCSTRCNTGHAKARGGFHCRCVSRCHQKGTRVEIVSKIAWDSRARTSLVDGLRARQILQDLPVTNRAAWQRRVPAHWGTPEQEMSAEHVEQQENDDAYYQRRKSGNEPVEHGVSGLPERHEG